VYVGASASTILLTPTIAVAAEPGGDENLCGITDFTGLHYVDFEVEPHCDAARFETMAEYAARTPNALYALDDLSAIRVVDGQVDVISGGTWKYFKK